ncbi:sugar ABC transporter substrate-binding protein [Flexivirga endophytica]|uniref:Sugar ABC transporter substrate-binding protein n=1 Tax=Flexivirga endophytica TaxID=1849103 RepID=A0A916WNR9_9MICO|nr:extracellular solute-binding protein [Flexivirga endophytica]GGB18323.1 sugar ABC transporter substrate-binding protein [Flexivirga endophytica]GHB37321.1 sugar ABC transporter substrate-binding protein [Flexivirga endophytica]
MRPQPPTRTGTPRTPSRRQLLAAGGGILLSGALAACGGNTGRSSGGSGDGSSAGGGGAGGGGAISQWYHQYGEQGTEQAVKKYAAAYKKAKVNVQWIPGNYDQKSAAALLTKSGPDVFEYGNGPTIDMITGKQVVDLTDVFGDAKDDFTASLLDRMTWKGKIYGVPQVVDMQLFVYRKSMLQKAGVQPPKTLDDLVAAAKKLTTGKVKGLFLGNDGGAGILAGPVLWSSGHDYLKDGEPDFANADVAGALAKFHELFTSGHLLLGAPTDWSDPGAITSGLTAMQWTGLWNFPMLKDKLGDDFGVLPFPAIGTSGKPSVPVGAYASCVSAKAKDVAAAKAFVKWLWVDQTDDQLDFAQSYGFHVPSRQSLIGKATKLQSGEAKTAAGYLKTYGHPQTPLLWSPKSATAMTDAIDKIVRSGADSSKSLAGVAKTVTAELKRIGG